MTVPYRRLTLILAAMVLVLSGAGTHAAITAMDVRLGDTFTGTIATAGVDTVEARFVAPQGASLRITVQAAEGASLRPVILIKDSMGTPLEGVTQSIGWLPVTNLIHYFTIPATGTYVVEVGGSSGAGAFWARLSGTPQELTPVAISGTVTNILTSQPIGGAAVLVDGQMFATTSAGGGYSGELAPGSYSFMFQAGGFDSATAPLTVASGSPAVLDIGLTPLVPVTVDAGVSGSSGTGGLLTGSTSIQAPPGATIQSITWTQIAGVPAGITGEDTSTPSITLGTESAYLAEVLLVLTEPPVTQDQLPPSVPLPEGEFPGGLQNRLQVVGINPFALEEAGLVRLKVEVVTSLGTFTDTVDIHTQLPWKVSSGLRNVATGNSVLLYAKEQAAYSWTLTPPVTSIARLTGAETRSPYFTPDIAGRYLLSVADGASLIVSNLEVFAGTWRGVIAGQDVDGHPIADAACTSCHNGILAPDKFTDWAQTGHAAAHADNMNTSSHYSKNCFACHTVGYDTGVANGGMDDAPDYAAYLTSGLLGNPGDNWTQMLADFPASARLANIQCENCHGPQNSLGHGFAGPVGEPRASLSANVCAQCHGEPLRHGRFQQWQLSAHANYEVAIEESQSGSCARCHTGNGFLTWLPILMDDDPGTDPTASIAVTWTADEAHPQTCATCHDPHMAGTTSGNNTDATVRISDDTPPLIGGFQAIGVGKGAICMTCHNSRRGARNDEIFASLSLSDTTRAPHGGSQSDVVMGQNGYYTEVGSRGGHSFLPNVCVDCHMKATPPPDVLSYNRNGANHTFYADKNICSECHSPELRAADVQDAVEDLLHQVGDLVASSASDLMEELIGTGMTINLGSGRTITDINQIEGLEITESRGRQALVVIFLGGERFGPVAVTSIKVLEGATDLGSLYEFADESIIKAGWNWALIHNDGSTGIHNPFFATTALIGARNALVAAPSAQAHVARALPQARAEVQQRLVGSPADRLKLREKFKREDDDR